MILEVTQKNVDKALAYRLMCPVEYALADAGYDVPTAAYTAAWARNADGRWQFGLSGSLTKQIESYDSGNGFKPGRYRVKVERE